MDPQLNMAEALARQLVRVAEVREHFREAGKMPNVNVSFALAGIDAALELGCKAAGSNDALMVMQAHGALKGIKE